MAIKPYLQLVRLPNLFTAAADSLAGWLLFRGSLQHPEIWLPLVGASVAIYAGGIVLNDLCDLEVDRAERPNRPLPSGKVSRRFAIVLTTFLFVLGMALTITSGAEDAPKVGFALIWCVVSYDALLKRSAFGPEVMGACRGLNLLLGMSSSARMFSPLACVLCASYALFVTGITWISRSEVGNGARRNIAIGGGLQSLALLGWLYAARFGFRYTLYAFPLLFRPRMTPRRETLLLLYRHEWGIVVLIVLAGVVASRTLAALLRPEPKTVQKAVMTGIFSLVWLHFGMLLSLRGLEPALLVGWLWIPAVFAGRWIYST